MLDGDFDRAWQVVDEIELPRRERMRQARFRRRPHELIWDGTPLEDRIVLIRCEHGLGDTIQFLRYAPLLRARSVLVNVQPELRTLAASAKGVCRVLCPGEPAPQDAVEIECMELPYALRTNVETIPREVPYVEVRPASLVRNRRGLHVGLVWSSGIYDPRRSAALADFRPIADIPEVTLYCLQQGPALSEADAVRLPMVMVSCHTQKVEAAAAMMRALDLIITVDSMTAHLAGALAVPVWTLLRNDADWRWMRDRDDSPWYPTMRLFRQRRAGDWAQVVGQVAVELGDYARSVKGL